MGSPAIWLLFGLIPALLFLFDSFPAFYGDEYWSLAEARNLELNPAGIGYCLQLRALLSVTDQDWALRCLSLFWGGVSVWALRRWLDLEPLSPFTRFAILLLWVTNPFLWIYFLYIRYYAYFVAGTVLTLWRFRAWQMRPDRANALWLLGSLLLLCSAQFFCLLVIAALVVTWMWPRLGRAKPLFLLVGLVLVALLFVPPIRQGIVMLEQRLENQPVTAGVPARGGVTVGLAKMVYAVHCFTLGRRLYPLWWWVSVPAMLISVVALARGLLRLRTAPFLQSLVVIFLLQFAFVFLVADTLAPAQAPGVDSRHVIFLLPGILAAIAVGMAERYLLLLAPLAVQVVGLGCLLVPSWNDPPVDVMDWRSQLREAIAEPADTCVLVDGRAEERVLRYAPPSTSVSPPGVVPDKLPTRLVLVSNDARLKMTRHLDDVALALDARYELVRNYTLFPGQVTVYERDRSGGLVRFRPSRLGLPEQDLRLPLKVHNEDWELLGFMRLDKDRPAVTVAAQLPPGHFLVASNYRCRTPVPDGTPVARLVFESDSGEARTFVLRANEDTASWACASNALPPPGPLAQTLAPRWPIRLPRCL